MIFSILTLFPEMFPGPLSYSINKKAVEKNIVKTNIVNMRDFSTDKYKTVDDHPYGGGVGMIIRVDIVDNALKSAQCHKQNCKERIILLDPKGRKFNQKEAKRLSVYDHLILVCGHYEGFDERVGKLVDEKISIGDYILTGGELPAMVMVDSITRLLPGVLKREATTIETIPNKYHEYPQYTKPQNYKNMKVPKVLLKGDHQKIKLWRQEKEKLLSSVK